MIIVATALGTLGLITVVFLILGTHGLAIKRHDQLLDLVAQNHMEYLTIANKDADAQILNARALRSMAQAQEDTANTEATILLRIAEALTTLSAAQDSVAMQTKSAVECMLAEPGRAVVIAGVKGKAN